MTTVQQITAPLTDTKSHQLRLAIGFLALLYAFLVALKGLILAFKLLNMDVVAEIMVASANPFVCLFIGLLTTALLHSSSTLTAMTIAIVASGTIAPTSAVYMIMGANIGTTITATIVALGHATRRKEFRKAISASMAHHFFNVFTVIIFLPLEYYTGFLSYISQYSADWFTQHIAVNIGYIFSPIDILVVPVASWLLYAVGYQPLLGIAMSIFLLFYILQFATKLFKRVWIHLNESPLQVYLFGNPVQALLLGTLITALLQSSTVVTSLIIPIVAANKISIKRVFPFIMGANLGTTFKAILVASSANEAAMSVAFMHFYFNLLGICLFFPLPAIRNLPVNLARKIGRITLKSRLFGFLYIVLIFFLLPFVLIFFSQQHVQIRQYTWVQQPNRVVNEDSPMFFYRQTLLPEADKLPVLPTQMYLWKKGRQVYFNSDVFILQKGQASSLIPTYRMKHTNKIDTCYMFYKGTKERLYFSAQDGLLVKRELLNTAGKVILGEELINVVFK